MKESMGDHSVESKEDASIRVGKGSRVGGEGGIDKCSFMIQCLYITPCKDPVKHPGRDLLAFTTLLNLLNLIYPTLPPTIPRILVMQRTVSPQRAAAALYSIGAHTTD